MAERLDNVVFLEFAKSIELVRANLGKNAEDPLSVVLAVSGGVDSRVMLDVAAKTAEESQLSLVVAHFDHGLREASMGDERFVEALSRQYNLPFFSERAPKFLGRENVEAWGRRLRYEFLEETRMRVGFDAVATAHHLDDQVETFFMRVISARLASSSHCIGSFDTTTRLFRPFLSIARSALSAYALRHNLEYVEDESNLDTSRTRNCIRHSLVPSVKKLNPNLLDGVTATINRLTSDEAELERCAGEALDSLGPSPNLARKIAELSPAIAWRVARLLAAREVPSAAKYLGYSSFIRAVEVARGNLAASDLGFLVSCFVDRDNKLRFKLGSDVASSDFLETDHADNDVNKLDIPGSIAWKTADGRELLLEAKLLSRQELEPCSAVTDLRDLEKRAPKEKFYRVFFDFDTLETNSLLVRFPRPGDSMRVWKRGRRKLKKLFQEQGVTLTERRTMPIVESSGKIIWVPGVARSEMAAVDSNTASLLQLTCLKTV